MQKPQKPHKLATNHSSLKLAKFFSPLYFMGFLLILFLPLQIRKVMFVGAPILNNFFPEWESTFVYLTDFIWLALIIAWLFQLFGKGRRGKRDKWLGVVVGALLLVAIIGISLNYNQVSLYRLVCLIQWLTIFLFFMTEGKKMLHWIVVGFVVTGVWTGILGIIQFFFQRSLGLRFLFEPILNNELTNVAKVVTDGGVLLRAYSIFPHPNVFACFLMIGLIMTVVFGIQYSAFSQRRVYFWLLNVAIAIQVVALFFTFSRSVWLMTVVGLVLVFGIQYSVFKSRRCAGTENRKPKIENLGVPRGTLIGVLILILAIVGVLSVIYWPAVTSRALEYDAGGDVALTSRLQAWEWGSAVIKESPVWGLGIGNFVPWLRANFDLEYWQYQPVPNAWVLIAAELGIAGLAAFVGLIVLVFAKALSLQPSAFSRDGVAPKDERPKTKAGMFHVERWRSTFLILAILLVALMFFDHYLWTIHQAFWLMAIIFGTALSLSSCKCQLASVK